MSEGSLPPFKYLAPRRYPAKLREAAGRLIERFRPGDRRDEKLWDAPGAPVGDSRTVTYPEEREINAGREAPPAEKVAEADRERAVSAMGEFLSENATNLERAVRTRERAERLEREGTPSDSARNRAERARGEIVDGLARLRRSFQTSGETGAARALELEAEKLNPPIQPEELRD